MSKVSYKYFLQPHNFSTYTGEPHLCDLCGTEQAGYKGPFYGLKQIEFVCEDCLVDGRLAEFNAFTNEGNIGELRKQIKEIHPEFSETDLEEIVKDRDFELLHRTPHVVSWQDFFWPVHCGDYCCFLKEAGKLDLIPIAPDGKYHLLFNDIDDEGFRYFWEGIRQDSPKDNSTAYSIGVYLFQCLHCQKYIVLNDSD